MDHLRIECDYTTNVIIQMEFPPEIVQLIRDFSKPIFPHSRIYKEVLRTFGFKRWPVLKDALQQDSTRVLVMEYLSAHQDWKDHQRVMAEHYRPKDEPFVYELFVTKSKYLKQQMTRKQYREQQKFRDLSIHLYVEPRILTDIRKELDQIGI